jgi:uncharacterized lipoprotein YddW (UPF0748 family)
MKKNIRVFIAVFLFSQMGFSQTTLSKREFRSVWIATVSNIDWPTSKHLSPAAQRSEYINILNKHKENGMNAVVSQIRPSCDAFYPSEIEPWSEWLTGTQGTPPNPFYDPLEFMIEEVHKRGMEYHAWFNPYRAAVNNSVSIHPTHITVTRPEWIVGYGSLKLLDPGLSEVREYVTSVIMDVVRRYDVDGVHFDDYFYPYPQPNVEFNDSATFANYPNGFSDKDDWRRNNINLLIEMVYDSIKAEKPWVKFGISPFGIWKNQSSDPEGSATFGLESYSAIYADSRKWIAEGWVDYMNPQIYWNIGYPAAAFDVLANWWADNSYGRHIYAGHAAYKINNGTQSQEWLNPSQMPNQIRLVRQIPEIKGSVFFSSKSITNNLLGVQDSLKNQLYKFPALIPEMHWLDSLPPLPPLNLQADVSSARATLTWDLPEAAEDGDSARQFMVYRFDYPDSINLEDPSYIRFISYNDTTRFFDSKPLDTLTNSVTYIVTSLDRLKNESEAYASITLMLTDVNDDANIVHDFKLEQNFPNPFNPATAINFSIPRASFVTLKLFDVLGKEISVLVNDHLEQGNHQLLFDAGKYDLPSGVYIYRISAGENISNKKMMFLK